MTKTETALMAKAEANGTVTVEFGYQGRRRFGRRVAAAASNLLRAGKLVVVTTDSTPLYRHGYGQNGRASLIVYRLVD